MIANAERELNATIHRFRALKPSATPSSSLIKAIKAKDEEDDTCIICYEMVPDCRFVGCHRSDFGYVCAVCADVIIKQKKTCPLCRGAVTKYEQVVQNTSSDAAAQCEQAVVVHHLSDAAVPDAWDD